MITLKICCLLSLLSFVSFQHSHAAIFQITRKENKPSEQSSLDSITLINLENI